MSKGIKITLFIIMGVVALSALYMAIGYFFIVQEDEEQIIDYDMTPLRKSPGKLLLETEDIVVKQNETKNFPFSIKNKLSEDTIFDITTNCEFSLANINWNASEFTLKHDKATKLLSTDDIDLHNLSIFVSSEATLTTWSCKIHITDDGEDYAKRAFFVTIQ